MSTENKPILFARQIMDLDHSTVAEDHAAIAKPLVSLVIPAYNEASILQENLKILSDYMRLLEDKYNWEMIIVNDGSKDDTSVLAKAFAVNRPNVFVLDHPVNFGLGQALKFAFSECQGDYIVTVDVDLSYTPDHIERLVDTLIKTHSKIVIASPYLKGGCVENVPPIRKLLSVGANRFLSIAAHGRLKTLTGMVRAYDAKFLRTLDFYSMGMEVNSEILYKAMVLRARIVEIPAALIWRIPKTPDEPAPRPPRKSSMRIAKYVMTLLVSGFLYRPIMFFLVPGLIALASAVGFGIWALSAIVAYSGIAASWNAVPAPFVISLISLLAAVQLLACGLISLQNKCYFEQMFHLGTTTYRTSRGALGDVVREGKR